MGEHTEKLMVGGVIGVKLGKIEIQKKVEARREEDFKDKLSKIRSKDRNNAASLPSVFVDSYFALFLSPFVRRSLSFRHCCCRPVPTNTHTALVHMFIQINIRVYICTHQHPLQLHIMTS